VVTLVGIRKRLQSLFIRSYVECSASTISKVISRLQTSVTAMGINSVFCMFKILRGFRRGSKDEVLSEDKGAG